MYYVVESVQGECVNSQVDQVFDTIKPSCDLITFFLMDNRCQVLDCVYLDILCVSRGRFITKYF